MALRPRTPGARALLPATRCRASGQLGALLSSPVLDVRLLTALQVLQVLLNNKAVNRFMNQFAGSRFVHGSRFTDSGRVLVGSRFTVRPDAAPPGSFTVRGSPFCPASVRVHGSEFTVGSRVNH